MTSKCSCGLLSFSDLLKSADRFGYTENRELGIICLLKVPSTRSPSVSLLYVARKMTENIIRWRKSYRKDGTELT